jgi:hypothetical protein
LFVEQLGNFQPDKGAQLRNQSSFRRRLHSVEFGFRGIANQRRSDLRAPYLKKNAEKSQHYAAPDDSDRFQPNVASSGRVIGYFRIAVEQLVAPSINGYSNRSEGKNRDGSEYPQGKHSGRFDNSK